MLMRSVMKSDRAECLSEMLHGLTCAFFSFAHCYSRYSIFAAANCAEMLIFLVQSAGHCLDWCANLATGRPGRNIRCQMVKFYCGKGPQKW